MFGSQDGVGTTPPLMSSRMMTATCTTPEISVERLDDAYMTPRPRNFAAIGTAKLNKVLTSGYL
jgi:hypothetical protein